MCEERGLALTARCGGVRDAATLVCDRKERSLVLLAQALRVCVYKWPLELERKAGARIEFEDIDLRIRIRTLRIRVNVEFEFGATFEFGAREFKV